jgi:prepilin-type N-terminal cleavage/methylation domain-containing protein
MRIAKQQKGVTLIEILIVVSIIGIISLISLPNFITSLRNYRLRAGAMNLLGEVRKTRTEAMANLRPFRFTVNTAGYTLTRVRLPYREINVQRLPLEEYLYEETEDELRAFNERPENKDVYFNHRGGIREMKTIPETGFQVTFDPSGTAQIPGTGFAALQVYGTMFGYEIRIYRGGQVKMVQIPLPEI